METFISIVIDLVVVILAYFIIKHSVKIGAAKTLVQIAGTVIALVLISTTTNILSENIYNLFIKERIETSIVNSITDNENNYKQAIKDNIPEYIIKSADFVGININKEIEKVNSEKKEEIAKSIETNVFKPVLLSAIKLVLIIILLILSVLIIKLLSKLTLVLNKIPVIGTANKCLGLIFGFVKALVVLVFICSVIMYISKNFNIFLDSKLLEKTFVFKYLSNLNFLF